MTDPFDVPERALPEHVRQAALRRIMTEIGDARPRRRRSGLAPMLIAASVVLLMAGATIVTSTLASKDDKIVNASPTTAHSTTTSPSGENGHNLYNAQLDWAPGSEFTRCWSADQKQDTWTPLLRVTISGLTAMLYRVGTDIVFCQLTREAATVKTLPYPNPPSGQQPAKLLFTTTEGTYAGVTAPGLANLVISSGNLDAGAPAAIGNGVFLLPNSFRPSDKIRLRGFTTPDYDVPAADLPQPQAPSLTQNDAKGDRTSAEGQRLDSCLKAANPPIVDADFWKPGGYLEIDGTHWIQLGSFSDQVLACQQNQGQLTVDGPLSFEYVGTSTEVTAKLTAADHGPPGEYFVVHNNDPQARTAILSVPGEGDVTNVVDSNGVCVLYRPHPPGRIQGQVTVKDAAGKVIDHFPVF